MEVMFKRTGQRRYATVVTDAAHGARELDPAPGYHDDVPHDLAHYLVECELGLTAGVFGRAARGGGAFRPVSTGAQDARAARRHSRKQRQREDRLRLTDHDGDNEMNLSERLAGLCLVYWARRHDPTARRPSWAAAEAELDDSHRAALERIVDRLDVLAPRWRALRVGDAIGFTWPYPEPTTP
ncbi:hypothetical protein [Nocardia sp. CC216A]|uniref:hypothetical protein n=2 Tax=Nocardia TaxID=1817 RepID=UPI0035591D0C